MSRVTNFFFTFVRADVKAFERKVMMLKLSFSRKPHACCVSLTRIARKHSHSLFIDNRIEFTANSFLKDRKG